jgi:phage regulator Rha-like protein
MEISIIQNKIHEIRGHKVMLDYDLSILYNVETKALNQAVKRNNDRFPKDFMFQLNQKEWNSLRSQFVTLEKGRGKYSKYLPYVFTEHGVTMLASVLKSKKAVKMNISIVKAFISLRQFALRYKELADQIVELKESVGNHNEQLKQIYDTLEDLLEEKTEEENWRTREPIGFRQTKK